MEDIRRYLAQHLLVTDGAMGTYLSSLTGRTAVACEMLNLTEPGLVRRVHEEYIRSGAKLLLTNTFSANSPALRVGPDETARVLRAGVELARAAADGRAWVAGDIGPLPEDRREEEETDREYRRIADVLLGEGVRIFQLETFAEADTPVRLARYIRGRLPQAFILISFAVTPDGYSRLGRSAESLIGAVRESGCADAAGFNCCSGPYHMLRFASRIDFGELIPSIRPNAGYPQREDDVLVYSGQPDYFARMLSEAPALGFRLVGGCCGTTPAHIRSLSQLVAGASAGLRAPSGRGPEAVPSARSQAAAPRLLAPKADGRRLVIVELDPPFDCRMDRMEQAARQVKDTGADALTVADSPMARPRADSVMTAARLRRMTGLDVIPHICCRDRNINAIKSILIAAHIEGVRAMLAVTGDPVSDTDRGSVKSVYNLNSVGLCGFVRDLNGDIFRDDPMLCGCAFNVNAANIGPELERLRKKVEAGASFVLTQPVCSAESVRALEKAYALVHPGGVRLFAGIMPPVSYKNALYLANEMPGFRFSAELVSRFSPAMTREEGERVGAQIALEAAGQAAPYADGFYFVAPFNRVSIVTGVVGELRRRGVC